VLKLIAALLVLEMLIGHFAHRLLG